MKKKIIISTFLFIVIAGIVFGFTVFNPNKNSDMKYKTEAVDKGDIEALVVTTGTLNPVILVDVGSQVSGKIEKIYVDFNSRVKERQVIAEIEKSHFLTQVQQSEANHQSAKASLEKAKVTLENNKKKYNRSLELFNKNLISYEEKESAETQYFSARADLQSAEAKLKQAKSQLDSSKVDLAYTTIKSPIDGVVINRNVNIGQTVAASFQAPVLFQIANDLSKMQVECSVDEADIGKINEGQKVKFTVDAFPDENFTGKVRQVRHSPEIVQNVVTYTTIVQVENPEMKLKPGMTATVTVVVGEAKNALRVPNIALLFTPQLNPEEMRKIFEDMDKESQKSNAFSIQADAQPAENQRPRSEVQVDSRMGKDRENTITEWVEEKNVSRVWILDENGKIKPISIKTGVTDNSYTEIVGGDLKESNQIITGIDSASERGGSSKDNDSMRQMMRMMR